MKHHGLTARVKNLVYPPIHVGPLEPWGRAIQDHFQTGRAQSFYVHDSDGLCVKHSTTEAYSATDRMRKVHEKALNLCGGRILDVGAGAGRHALTLSAKGLEVLAVDIEPRCIEIMHARGLKSAQCTDIHNFRDASCDTILLLEHTVGLAGTLDGLVKLMAHLARLLSFGGQIILDSMSPGRFAGSPHYPGARILEFFYGRYAGAQIPWLYVDYDVLRICAKQISLEIEMIMEGSTPHDYLARAFRVEDD